MADTERYPLFQALDVPAWRATTSRQTRPAASSSARPCSGCGRAMNLSARTCTGTQVPVHASPRAQAGADDR